MLKHFTLFTALILTVFAVGCSAYTEIFIDEVNILPTGDGGDLSWLDDIDIPIDDILIDGWGDDASCPSPSPDDTTPPTPVEGTVIDGEIDVDPELLNAEGIQITFDEHVAHGMVELRFEDGTSADWLGIIESDTIGLYLSAGNELDYETTYIVAIEVYDAAGNMGQYTITFVTATPPPEPAN